jgi:hypothetical protein
MEWKLVSAGACPAGDDQLQLRQVCVVHQQHAVLVRELVGRLGEDRVRDHHRIRRILKGSGGIDLLNRLVADGAVIEFALDDNPSVVLLRNDVGALVA